MSDEAKVALAGDDKGTLSAVLVPSVLEYLVVQVTFHRGSVKRPTSADPTPRGMSVTFHTEKGNGEAGTLIVTTTTDSRGYAGPRRAVSKTEETICPWIPVPAGRYICTIEGLGPGGKTVPIVVTTVPDWTHPHVIPLPLGRPHFDVCDPEPVRDPTQKEPTKDTPEVSLKAQSPGDMQEPGIEAIAKLPADLRARPVVRLRPIDPAERSEAQPAPGGPVGAAFSVELGGAIYAGSAIKIGIYQIKDPISGQGKEQELVSVEGTIESIEEFREATKTTVRSLKLHPGKKEMKPAKMVKRGDTKKAPDVVSFRISDRWIPVPIQWHGPYVTDRICFEARIVTPPYNSRSSVGIVARAAPLVPSPRDATYDWHEGNQVKLYNDGAEGPLSKDGLPWPGAFADIVAAIREAEHFVFIVDWSFHPYFRILRTKAGLSDQDDLMEDTIGRILCDEAKNKNKPELTIAILTWNHTEIGAKDRQNDDTAKIIRKINGGDMPKNMHVLVHARGIRMEITHHQKFVVLDCKSEGEPQGRRDIKAFFGGLDLSRGRFDWSEHLVESDLDPAGFKKTIQPAMEWSFMQWNYHPDVNPTLKGVDDWYNAEFDDGKYVTDQDLPRQPWHDIHGCIQGPAAWDFVHEFVGRFQSPEIDKVFEKLRNKDEFIQQYELREGEGSGPWSAQVLRSTTKERWSAPVPRSHELPSYPRWERDEESEKSIQQAYLRAIEQAERFIYIETQYLIGGHRKDWLDDKGMGRPLNGIPDALANRIVARAKDRKDFHVYILCPLFPEGDPAGDAITVRRFEWRTMEYLIGKVRSAPLPEGKSWEDYLSFYFLANTALPEGVSGREKESGRIHTVKGGRELMLHVLAQTEYKDAKYKDTKDPDPARYWRHIYCHPFNKAFRALRPNPDRYKIGDRIYLPSVPDIERINKIIDPEKGEPGESYTSKKDSEPITEAADVSYGDNTLWPLLRYDPTNKKKVWKNQEYFYRKIPRAGTTIHVPEPILALADASDAGKRKARVKQGMRYMVYIHSKLMIIDDQYVLLGSANLNERSLAGDRDTEICVAMWPSTPENAGACRDTVKGLRKRLFEEHYGSLPPGWAKPESPQCVRAMKSRADHNYFQLACFKQVKGHLARLPLQLDGASGPLKLKTLQVIGVEPKRSDTPHLNGPWAVPDYKYLNDPGYLLDYDTTVTVYLQPQKPGPPKKVMIQNWKRYSVQGEYDVPWMASAFSIGDKLFE